MSAVATYLKERTADDVRLMDPRTRIRMALEIGDADLAAR